jgi:hypothetical protein
MTTSNGIFHLICNNSPHDKMLIPSEFLRQRILKIQFGWDIEPRDILKLKTWHIELARMVMILENHIHIPKVLCDIVIEYTGSIYENALIKLGTSLEFLNLVRKCKLESQSRLNVVRSIMNTLDRMINKSPPRDFNRKYVRGIINTGIARGANNENYRHRCAIFHNLLLTHF